MLNSDFAKWPTGIPAVHMPTIYFTVFIRFDINN